MRSIVLPAYSNFHFQDKDTEDAPGLIVQFQSFVSGWEAKPDSRVARLVALNIPSNQPPTPFLPAGRFKATWQGKIDLELGGDYIFSSNGRGKLQVKINGAEVLTLAGPMLNGMKSKPVALKQGSNEIQVAFESPAEGDSVVRLNWESSEFRQEPLAWSVIKHNQFEEKLVKSQQLRQGRELIATQRCLNCHTLDKAAYLKEGGMPELGMDAPNLTDLGSRIHGAWLARWIQDPSSLRPSATMPRVLGNVEAGDKTALDGRAIDMAAYLVSLGARQPEEDAPKAEMIPDGARLFTQLGCLACHTAPDKTDFAVDEKNRIPLRDISAKWQAPALRAFLLKPDSHYQWIRMPNFAMKVDEAKRLEAYLLSSEKRQLFIELPKNANLERGKELVQSSGCLNCHGLKLETPLGNSLKVPAWSEIKPDRWNSGCLNARKEHRGPILNLSKEQHQQIQMFAADTRESLKRDNPIEFASRQMRILRCNACHRRDNQEDDWTQLREDEMGIIATLPPVDPESEPKHFKADQIRPSLTWTGEKLNPDWLTAFIAGKVPYKPREYLRARMPAFTRRADLLAEGLAEEHGYSGKNETPSVSDVMLADTGRELVGKKRWGCTACHDMGKTEAVGVFESPGPNFMYIKERLRRDYYDRWIWMPTRVEPGTKMPQVYMFGKPSLLADVLGGDANQQIDAIWHYTLQGRALKAPGE